MLSTNSILVIYTCGRWKNGAYQKSNNNGYTTVNVSTSSGNYVAAYCQVQVFNGATYVNSSNKTKCIKGNTVTLSNTSSVSWVSGTYLKLRVWSSDASNMDYDKVTWNYN